jgi:hypothetical protein
MGFNSAFKGLKAESTAGPECGQKDYVDEKFL